MSPRAPAATAPRRRLSAADRRAAILDAALAVFAERGFSDASLDEVASRGGISKALIYEHFASKRDLQLAVLDTFVHELIGRVVQAVGVSGPREERMHRGIEAFLGFAEERPEALRLLTRNVADPVAGEMLDRLREEAASAVAEIMASDAPPPQQGDLALEARVAILAHLIAGGVQFLAGWWIEHREIPRERLAEAVMDLFWVGLDRLAAGERWRR